MPDEIRRVVDIPFPDGTVRPVLMNHNAKIEAESAYRDMTGNPTPFYTLVTLDGYGPLRALLWAGLRGADPSLRVGPRMLTLEAAGDLLEEWGEDEAKLACHLYGAIAIADKHRTVTEDDRKNVLAAVEARINALYPPTTLTTSDASPADSAASATETGSN